MTRYMNVQVLMLISALILLHVQVTSATATAVTVTATASSNDPLQLHHHDHHVLHNYQSTNESRIQKLRKRLCIHETNQRLIKHKKLFHRNSNTKAKANSNNNNNNYYNNMKEGSCRTRFMFQLPTSQQLYQIMFSNLYKYNSNNSASTSNNSIANNIRHFNHPFVGITKPIGEQEQLQYHTQQLTQQQHDHERVITVSLDPQTQQNDGDSEWWPQSLDTLAHDISNTPYNRHGHTNVNANANADPNANANANANMHTHNDATTTQRGPWRIKRYTKRIGHGQQCYDRVRDAALDWEFTHFHNDDDIDGDDRNNRDHDHNHNRRKPAMGILRASPPPSTDPFQENTNPNILQICNHPSIIQQKKIATFTLFTLTLAPRFSNMLRGIGIGNFGNVGNGNIAMPSVYVVNPVAVVYDIVDQFSSKGDRFTSTAYCTLKGHLISGEERVTVILRNNDNDHHYNDHDHHYNHNDGHGHDYSDFAIMNHGHASSRTRTHTHTRINNTSKQQQHANDSTCTRSGGSGGYVDVEILSYSKPAPTWMGKLVWPFIAKKQDEFFQRELEALEKVAIGVGGGCGAVYAGSETGSRVGSSTATDAAATRTARTATRSSN